MTDGTPEGTRLAADALPGHASSDPQELTAAGDRIVFRAQGALYASDGVTTTPLANFPTEHLTQMGGYVYFARTTLPRGQVWRTDGTPQGTAVVGDVSADGPVAGYHAAPDGQTMYVVVSYNFRDWRLWKTQGTPATTVNPMATRATSQKLMTLFPF